MFQNNRDRLLERLLMTAALLLIACSTPGCVNDHGSYKVLSNKLVRTSDFKLSQTERKRSVVGEDIAHIILFIPTKGQVTLEEAIDDALRKGGGDVLTDASVEFFSWWIPLIYGQEGWRVTGDVVSTREAKRSK